MKKLLLIVLGFIFIQAFGMEEQDDCEKVYERGMIQEIKPEVEPEKDVSKSESEKEVLVPLTYLLGMLLPNEIRSKIFSNISQQGIETKELLSKIQSILNEKDIKFQNRDSMRHMRDQAFKEIGRVIQSFPPYTYAKAALYITLSGEFSPFEKLHFLGLMSSHKDVTEKQNIIIEFLAQQARNCLHGHFQGPSYTNGKITKEELILNLLFESYHWGDNELNIKLSFLLKQGIAIPKNMLAYLVKSNDKSIIPLIQYALENGADADILIPNFEVSLLKYYQGMLKAWLDKDWLNGPENSEYCFVKNIGNGQVKGFNREHVPSKEAIQQNREFYENIIALLNEYQSKSRSQNMSEVDTLKSEIDEQN